MQKRASGGPCETQAPNHREGFIVINSLALPGRCAMSLSWSRRGEDLDVPVGSIHTDPLHVLDQLPGAFYPDDGLAYARIVTRYMLRDQIANWLQIPRHPGQDEFVANGWPPYVAFREAGLLLPLGPRGLLDLRRDPPPRCPVLRLRGEAELHRDPAGQPRVLRDLRELSLIQAALTSGTRKTETVRYLPRQWRDHNLTNMGTPPGESECV